MVTDEDRKKLMVEARLPEGTHCELCGRYAKVYRRSINASMARGLILLYKATKKRMPPQNGEMPWIEIREALSSDHRLHGDFGKLAYWGLIERKPHDPDEKKSLGLWRITYKGAEFARNQILLPKYVSVWDGNPSDFSDEKISITQALGDAFNYVELMHRGDDTK